MTTTELTYPDPVDTVASLMIAEEMELFCAPDDWGSCEDAAVRGAVFLDRVMPGWHRQVEIIILDISSPCACVLGQIFSPMTTEDDISGFYVGQEHLGLTKLTNTSGDLTWSSEEFFGFDHIPGSSYADLTEAWAVEILKRKG